MGWKGWKSCEKTKTGENGCKRGRERGGDSKGGEKKEEGWGKPQLHSMIPPPIPVIYHYYHVSFEKRVKKC